MAAKKEKKAVARGKKGGDRGESPPPPPSRLAVEGGPVGDALNRLRDLMDDEDLSAGSIATVACSYANTALAAENLTLQKRWDLELLRGMEEGLIELLVPMFGRWADSHGSPQWRLVQDLYDALDEEPHPAADVLREAFRRALWPAAGG